MGQYGAITSLGHPNNSYLHGTTTALGHADLHGCLQGHNLSTTRRVQHWDIQSFQHPLKEHGFSARYETGTMDLHRTEFDKVNQKYI